MKVKKRGNFLRQIKLIKSKSTIDESVFETLLDGLKYFIKVMEHSFDVFKDIIIQWMDTILYIKNKSLKKSARKLFQNNLSQFTQLFASIMVRPIAAESSFKLEFLSIWSKIISDTNRAVKRRIAKTNVEAMAWICKSTLAANHFLTQTCGLELFFKYIDTCRHNEKDAILKMIIIDNFKELDKMLLAFNVGDFITESRKLLNKFNKKMSEGAVHSITVKAGFIENFPIIKPQVEEDLDFWLDFNNRNSSVSFFCDVRTFSEGTKINTVNIEIFLNNITLNKNNNMLEVQSNKIEIFPSGSYEILKSNNKFRFHYYKKDLPFLSSIIASYQPQTEENGKPEDALAQNGREFEKNSNSRRNKKMFKQDQKEKAKKCDNYAKDYENANPENLEKSENQEKSVGKINQIITDPLLDTEVNAVDVQNTSNRTLEKSENKINGINKELADNMFVEDLEITKKTHIPPKNDSTFNKNLMNENSLQARSSCTENKSEILRSASCCRDSKQRKAVQFGNQPPQEDVMIIAKTPIPKIFTAQQTKKNQYIRKRRKTPQKTETTAKFENLTKPLTDKSKKINTIISKSRTNEPSIAGNREEIQNLMEEDVRNDGCVELKNALKDNNISKQLNTHQREVLSNNLERINTILEGTANKFFKNRPSYQRNQVEYIYEMKNVVPKFIGGSKIPTFSYRRDENSKPNFKRNDVNKNVSRFDFENTKMHEKTDDKRKTRNKNNSSNKEESVQNEKVTVDKPEQLPEISQHVPTAIVHRETSPEPLQVENRGEMIEAQPSVVQLRRESKMNNDFDALMHLSNFDNSYQSITVRRANHLSQFQNNDWTTFEHGNFNEIIKGDKSNGPFEVTVKENTELISMNPKELDPDASSSGSSQYSVENLLQDDNLDLDSYIDEDYDSLKDADLEDNRPPDNENRESIGSDDIQNISKVTYTVEEPFCIPKRKAIEKAAEIDTPRKKRKTDLDVLPHTQLICDVQTRIRDVFEEIELQNQSSFDETLKFATSTIKEYFKDYTKHFQGVKKSLNKIEEIRKEFEKEQRKLNTVSNYGCKHLLKLTSGLDKLKKTLNDQKDKGDQNIQSKFKTEADFVLRQRWESYLNELIAMFAGNIQNLSNLKI